MDACSQPAADSAGSEPVYIKTTEDGRKVEVIDGWVCLAGHREASSLIEIMEHPNRQAIRRAVPGASHVAGRLPLTHEEAAVAQGALDRAKRAFVNDPVAINERFRIAMFRKTALEGVE